MQCTRTMFQWSMALCLLLSMTVFTVQEASAKAKIIDRDGNPIDSITQDGETGSVEEQDSLALVALYHSTNGDGWDDNSGWFTEKVEFWFGVDEVEEIEVAPDVFEWRVTRIDLRSNFLVGEVPVEIGMLDELEVIQMRQNHILGTIPPEVGQMTSLRVLGFHNNNSMAGPLPWVELSELPNLTSVQGAFANFYGELPPEVGNFPVLTQLAVQGNPFSGDVPAELGQVNTLTSIFFSETFFTGPMPEEWSNLEELNVFFLLFSPFLEPGPIPEFMSEMEELTHIRISATNRTGEIPEWIETKEGLGSLWVGGFDELKGPIPDLTFIGETLQMLFIWDSNISGEVPDYLGDMPALRTLYLKGIPVTGSLPSNLGDAPSLTQIYLKDLPNLEGPLPDLRNLNMNRLRINNIGFDIGPIPEWLSTQTGMAQMRLANAGLEGTIPESWSEMVNLQWLIVEGNPGITGELPSWVTDGNEMLREIRLGNTNIDLGGEIPDWICEMEQLEMIRLEGLGLSGSIPPCLGDLIRLGDLGDVGRFNVIPHAIVLADNELTGTIPPELGKLSFVNGIDLSNNQLSGEIPDEFYDIGLLSGVTILEVLDLSGNPDLEGPLSTNITRYNPNVLRKLHYNDTGLCEPDDAGFQDWIQQMEETEPSPGDIISFRGIGGRSVERTNKTCGEATSADNMEVPNRLALSQNYPNPFNPSTTISYSVPSEVHVELTVYDVLGQRVATLVNESVSAGQYEVNFDASSLSSGTYIYRLVTEDQSLSQTMMLVK